MPQRNAPGRRRFALALCLVVALTGCGSAVTAESSSGAPVEGFPFTDADNCGITTGYAQPPARAATLTSNATELMLELGLADRMVGTAYLKGRTIGEQYRADYERIPVLADAQPSLERLLEVQPDFVYSGYPDGFSASSGHTRERLAELSVKTHLNPEGCATGPVTFDTLFAEMRTIGGIFGVPENAEASIERFSATLAGVRAELDGAEPVKVFVYNSGTDAAQTAGGHSMLNEIIAQAGGVNVFADEPQRWMKVSWEQVAQRRPDVVLIYDYVDPPAEAKVQALRNVPALAHVPAIRDSRFPVISLSLAQPGPRSVEGVVELAAQLHPDRFGG